MKHSPFFHPFQALLLGVAGTVVVFGLLDSDFFTDLGETQKTILTAIASIFAAYFALQGPLLQISEARRDSQKKEEQLRFAHRSFIPDVINELDGICSTGIGIAFCSTQDLLNEKWVEATVAKLHLSQDFKKRVEHLLICASENEARLIRFILITHQQALAATEFQIRHFQHLNTDTNAELEIRSLIAFDWAICDGISRHLYATLNGENDAPQFPQAGFFRLHPYNSAEYWSEPLKENLKSNIQSFINGFSKTPFLSIPHSAKETSRFKKFWHDFSDPTAEYKLNTSD